ncbi:uncharacterized protein LOC129233400 [Uloborus diversus]|uniref:uncharacterized protein LOC129233400 n=1 Tax=Uloborus diversus TaxID=327109 RepID=UPI00240A2FCB|nr:uncharacterized protein LOC129233400 [Uloborus diversus]
MSCELADKLELRKVKANVSVSCLTGVSMNVKFKTSAVIRNKGGGYSRVLDFLIVPKITQITPVSHATISEMGIFENVNLADSEFNRSGKIELLLGAEVFFELLRFGQLHVPNSNLVLQNTVFGFIVGGSTKDNSQPKDLHCGLINEAELSREIKKFWEIESIDETDQFKSSEEIECNEHFLKTHKRDQSGRFVVQMPFKQDPRLLGDSKQIAIKRLNSLWNRLNKNPKLADLYCKFMTEYERLGHMERVMEIKEPTPCYYLPHHGVYRPEKNLTKLRVVLNGSQITSTGESLNSLQMNGGVIQEDLFSIILRFRTHRYAFTADVRMMYRMINVDESQRDMQRIVWKNSKSEEVKTYRLCTVTYGTTSAPYLAMRCLKQLSVDGEQQYPKASTIVKSDFYMDDVLTGAADLETAKDLKGEIIELLGSCGMHLHKWCGNHPQLIDTSSDADCYDFDKLIDTKTLGLLWKSQNDVFAFNLSCEDQPKVTKRTVLSKTARIFDPLGLLGPIVTKAKIILHRLWKLKVDWDESLPKKETEEWLRFIHALKKISNVYVDRYALFAKDNVKLGSLVLIKEDNLPCCKWLIGRTIQLHKGSDDKVRVVKIRTTTGELKRSVTKIALLPIEN